MFSELRSVDRLRVHRLTFTMTTIFLSLSCAVTQWHEDESEAAVLAALGPAELGQGPMFTFPLTEEAQDERAPLHVQTHTIYSTHTCTVTDLCCIEQPVHRRPNHS